MADGAIAPVTDNDVDLGTSSLEFKDGYFDGTLYTDAINLNGTAITSTAAELNILDGVTSTAAELNILDGVTSTAAELNILDGVTSTTAELNILDGVTSTAAELNILDGVTSTAAELNTLDGITAVVGELNALDLGSTAVGTAIASKAVVLDSNKDYTGIRNLTATGEISMATLDIGGTNVTSTAAELNILDGVTSTAAELNTLDGITAVVGELNALDLGSTAIGTAVASKAVVLDSNKDYTGIRNFTITGDLTVGGTQTVVDTVTMNAQNAVVFEGATADDYETTLTITDPTADRTIKLPNQSGTLPVLAADSDTAITSTPAELNLLDGVTATTAELNILDGVTSTAAELNIMDGVTATTAELNIMDGVTATTAELNIMDGVTSTAAELNIVDGNTSATSTAVADADRVVLNDNGTMVQVAVTDLAAYFDDEITAMPNLVTTAATTVGALNSGSITSGFGSIDNGSSAITTTGTVTYGSLSDGSITITAFVDEDGMDSNSATLVPTQQSVKAYVDDNRNVTGLNATGAELNTVADTSAISIDTSTAVANNDAILMYDNSGTAIKYFDVDLLDTYYAGTTSTLTNKTLTAPKFADGGFIADANGNELIMLQTASSAVNQLEVTNSASGGSIVVGASGDDSNIDIDISPKGTGEVNIAAGNLNYAGTAITSTGAELNLTDGSSSGTIVNSKAVIYGGSGEVNATTLQIAGTSITASAADINLIDGITNGTVIASKAIITDSNKDISGGRNITISGELDAATLDISGDADIDGTLEADAITVNGTALNTVIANEATALAIALG